MSDKTTKNKTRTSQAPVATPSGSGQERTEETPFEAIASICSVLAVLLFIQTFIAQNFVIPSGSMEDTLLIGDHLVVDRTNMAAPANWMPLVYHRAPRRGDVVVFIKPVPDQINGGPPQYLYLVKRLIGVPGDHIHLQDGTVYINGVAQVQPHAKPTTADNFNEFLDNFPSLPAATQPGATEEWAVAEPHYISDGNLVVPAGMYFMMGDNRHDSLDSRYWGFVPRANIIGRPLFNYWSFKTPEDEYNETGIGARVKWVAHIVLHFFTDTRWKRTFHVIH
ncbi:MAG TPA: signal peptidase I [Terracidiphilus sp.]|nr:signal peptidase I [Terracidiphilus sp.]